MGNQRTFASVAWNAKGKVTRRERFLAEMDAVIPWPRLVRLIEPHYPKAGQGRQPLGLEKMLRIYFLQQWFNLSDPQAEDAIYDSESMRRFARVELGEETASCPICCMGRSASCSAIKRTGRKTIEGFSRPGGALPDQPASYRAAAVERALADDQPGALADAGARRTAFRVVKQLWGFAKVRYRGLAKNLARAQTMFALANLYQLRRELLPAGARCVL